MADEIYLKLEGVDQLKAAVKAIPEQFRKRVLRNALAAGARQIRDAARAAAPTLKVPRKGRKPGTVREAIVVRTSRVARQSGDVGVYVGVRPLRGIRERRLGRRGADNPNDPYYWWWVEFGHKLVPRSASVRAGGVGLTLYKQRLRNGRILQRVREFRKTSITGRRRAPVGYVSGRRFITNASKAVGQQAIDKFMATVVPQIEKLNAKGALNVR